MKRLLSIAMIFAACGGLKAQNLTPAQKDSDFRYLASLYSTYYAGTDWKKQLFNFDALSIKPWLDRAAATKTDLDFYDLMVEYVASLHDTHDTFTLPSDFVARLGFTTDLYDGVLLIDSLNRTLLPAGQYPFTIGDEFVSLDGVAAADLLTAFAKYAGGGHANPLSEKRIAAARITIRAQSLMPHATDVLGKSATVVIRRQNGTLETYTIPWSSTGTPLEVGPTPTPKFTARVAKRDQDDQPDYMTELVNAQWSGFDIPDEGLNGLNGYGARNPIFINGLANFAFTRRLGGNANDFFYSGTFKFAELTIGYIRIPNYAPPSTTTATTQLAQEIAYMNANTDGLVIDEMRNTGGLLCFGETVATLLINQPFRATGFRLRPYWTRILGFYNSLVAAESANAPQAIVDQYQMLLDAMVSANQQGMLTTDSLPLCTSSLLRSPAPNAYTKPEIFIVDEFSTSTADSVAGMMQDSGRAVLLGKRTMGAGGNNTSFDAGPYTEGITGMTLALQVRPRARAESGYPYTDNIENVGVWPQIPVDYMTKDNLLQNGTPFISAFLNHMAAEIRARK
jgi:hypothetical protein